MKEPLVLAVMLLFTVGDAFAQDPAPAPSTQDPPPAQSAQVPAPVDPQHPVRESNVPPATVHNVVLPPLTTGEKFHYYVKHSYGPMAFGKALFGTGILQAWDKPTEWGQGMEGFGHRYASSMAQHAVKKTIEFGVGAALHEDPRRPRSGLVGFWPRTGYAISHTYIVRKDGGSQTIAIGRITGTLGGALISRAWQPERNQTVRSGLMSAGQSAAVDVGLRVLHEFWPEIRRMFRR